MLTTPLTLSVRVLFVGRPVEEPSELEVCPCPHGEPHTAHVFEIADDAPRLQCPGLPASEPSGPVEETPQPRTEKLEVQAGDDRVWLPLVGRQSTELAQVAESGQNAVRNLEYFKSVRLAVGREHGMAHGFGIGIPLDDEEDALTLLSRDSSLRVSARADLDQSVVNAQLEAVDSHSSLLSESGCEGFGQKLAEHVAPGALFQGSELVDFGEGVGAEPDGYVVSRCGFSHDKSVTQRCTPSHERATVSHMTTHTHIIPNSGGGHGSKECSIDHDAPVHTHRADGFAWAAPACPTAQHSVRVVAQGMAHGGQTLTLECATQYCEWFYEMDTSKPMFEDLAAVAEDHEANPTRRCANCINDVPNPGGFDLCDWCEAEEAKADRIGELRTGGAR